MKMPRIQIVEAKNQAERQPVLNLQIAQSVIWQALIRRSARVLGKRYRRPDRTKKSEPKRLAERCQDQAFKLLRRKSSSKPRRKRY